MHRRGERLGASLDWCIVEVHVEVLRDQVVSLLGVGALFVPADKGHLVACPLCKPVTQHCAFAKKIYAMPPKWGKQSLHGLLILGLFLEWTGCHTFCVAKNGLNGVMLFLRRLLRISTCRMAHK